MTGMRQIKVPKAKQKLAKEMQRILLKETGVRVPLWKALIEVERRKDYTENNLFDPFGRFRL